MVEGRGVFKSRLNTMIDDMRPSAPVTHWSCTGCLSHQTEFELDALAAYISVHT